MGLERITNCWSVVTKAFSYFYSTIREEDKDLGHAEIREVAIYDSHEIDPNHYVYYS